MPADLGCEPFIWNLFYQSYEVFRSIFLWGSALRVFSVVLWKWNCSCVQKTPLCLTVDDTERLGSHSGHQGALLFPISWCELWWKWWKAAMLTLETGRPATDFYGCYFFLLILLNSLPRIKWHISWDNYLLHFLTKCFSSEDLHFLYLQSWGSIHSSECLYDFSTCLYFARFYSFSYSSNQ